MDDDMSNWRKSSFSHANGNCIEVAASRGGARWVKSSLSFSNGQCAEVAAWQEGGTVAVGVRDTKDHGAGPVLTFPAGAWEAFTGQLKAT
jgi:Domain of unknown function (DUF397)